MCCCAHTVRGCGRLAGFFGLGIPLRGMLKSIRMMVRTMRVCGTAMRFSGRFVMFGGLGVLCLWHDVSDPILVTEIGNTGLYRVAGR